MCEIDHALTSVDLTLFDFGFCFCFVVFGLCLPHFRSPSLFYVHLITYSRIIDFVNNNGSPIHRSIELAVFSKQMLVRSCMAPHSFDIK